MGLDLVAIDGEARAVVAQAEPFGSADGATVVLLERRQATLMTIAQAGHLALADLGPRLAASFVAVSVAQWPEGRIGAAARAMLVEAMGWLLDMANPAGGRLSVAAQIVDGYSVEFAISLNMANVQEASPSPNVLDHLDGLMERTNRANGYFGLELADSGVIVKLEMPLA